MYYLLKLRKKYVVYLGQDISLFDLFDVNCIYQVDYIFMMIIEMFVQEFV